MPRRATLRVFQSHGLQDELLPCAVAERLRDALRAAGLDVTWVEFQGGHGIPPRVLSGLGAYLGQVLA
jgi:phospholipase/carboxylesterase